MVTAAQRELLLSGIRDVPDWPEPGILFKDITPLLRNPSAFAAAVDLLAGSGGAESAAHGIDAVVGIEARGFILGAPVAQRLRAGFVPVRKAGKLPSDTAAASYELEYGEATVEMHRDALAPGDTVLIVDDVLATGGTARATIDLVRGAGAEVAGVSVLMELGFLNGREKLTDVTLTALLSL
jgi:adenine phosphoribosyltransferase